MLASYRHLENFCKVFDRLYKKKHLYLWKKEFQRRGVVHYHLICNLPKDVSKTAITRIWNRCAGQVYRKCGKLNKSSTNCSKVKKQQSIGWYLSQYVEKKNHQTDAPVDRLSAVNRDGETVAGYIGRWWGVINKKNYVRRVIEKIIVDAETARLIEELIHSVDGKLLPLLLQKLLIFAITSPRFGRLHIKLWRDAVQDVQRLCYLLF